MRKPCICNFLTDQLRALRTDTEGIYYEAWEDALQLVGAVSEHQQLEQLLQLQHERQPEQQQQREQREWGVPRIL